MPRPTTARQEPLQPAVSKVNIPTELHQRARAAVRIVERVTGRRYPIAQFLREAISAQLALIARDYNQGREILPDTAPLAPGRQVRSPHRPLDWDRQEDVR